ncbi:MAG: 4-alpha-glucanotransferase [Clostridia bacterium]|nr:4-alpha-glucanotransferase [Clostridia bacterium]
MRKSGILMHIASLPSPGGIGTLGREAYRFVDFLASAGMSIWQVLPTGPVGYAESPYQSPSTFAGNELFIDPELLEEDGILPNGCFVPVPNTSVIDYAAVRQRQQKLLRTAFEHSGKRLRGKVDEFRAGHSWVDEYAFFAALKTHFDLKPWFEWPDENLRLRKSGALAAWRERLKDEIDYCAFVQYLFFRQWDSLHRYAHSRGIEIMGDMPIYVSEDSADVWIDPELFELDEDCRPIRIAGVPPDYFQKDGQRWGNPLYRWDRHRETGYRWWIERLRSASEQFDILRIDHFIGFVRYYAIPSEEATARNGKYEKGPGVDLFRAINKAIPKLKIVAEDLGVVVPEVRSLLKECGFPGMKVLQFAFGSGESGEDLPEKWPKNCFAYTGTHDNPTSLEWWKSLRRPVRAFARGKLGMEENSNDIIPALKKTLFASHADTVIMPMQDLLSLGTECRMNYPGTLDGNWKWRMLPQDLSAYARELRRLNYRTNRGSRDRKSVSALIARAEEICLGRFHVFLCHATAVQLHDAVARAVMEQIAERWQDDADAHQASRHAVYLSLEYLTGRLIYNNLYALGLLEDVRQRLADKGVDLAVLEDIEDAALGNGGLGRLAVCLIDSAATHDIPLDGYGLRYRYGLFKQAIENCSQKELPDDWTRYGDPWSIRRDELAVDVPVKGVSVRAVPYDMPVIGYGRSSISTIRLWQCESPEEFEFSLFNDQDYQAASGKKNIAEDITKVLYPNDTLDAGKRLRLRQQYVLCSASLQDMLRTYRARWGSDYSRFADLHAVQMNDTHPAMAIPELIRLLTEDGVGFARAFSIAQKTFRYTNHTVMREALEQWDIHLMSSVSPDIVRIIRRIQTRLSRELSRRGVADTGELDIVHGSTVRMANLAIYGSSFTNGVAQIHTQLIKKTVFREWYTLYPERFINKTNGVTQRRWLGLCDPELCALLDRHVKGEYITDLDRLASLRPAIDDRLALEFAAVKLEKKRQLREVIRRREGIDIPESFVFDVQIKRLHEYKRQLLNAFSILDIYFGLKDGTIRDFPPTAFIFGAKSAPGYRRAKAIIRYINQIAAMVNGDEEIRDRMRVVFVHDYNCSYAEHIIPAADISEQISPAGTEASGTSNMKLTMNGACTLGTFDGANIEIVEQAGKENNYIFGATVEEIDMIRDKYDARAVYEADPRLKRVVDTLVDGTFEDEDGGLRELYTSLLEGASWHRPDHHFIFVDYASYMDAKLRAIRDTRKTVEYAKKCLYNIAGSGKFSSDRTVREYAKEIWMV